MTGESEPLLRSSTCTSNEILETKNIAFFSTNAVEGTAQGKLLLKARQQGKCVVLGIVVACGDHTVMGRIAGLTARIESNKTPIAKELDFFMKVISCWAVSLGVVFGIVSMTLEYSLMDSALFLIGIIVANVPEGMHISSIAKPVR